MITTVVYVDYGCKRRTLIAKPPKICDAEWGKLLVALMLMPAATAFAEAPPPAPPIQIHRDEGASRIDGDLSDPGWKNAATVSAFFEGQPGDNTPAKVKTIA